MRYTLSKLSRGGSVALLTVAAQAVSAQVAPARPRGDTVTVQIFMNAKMDTISAIMRALDHERFGSPAWAELTHKLDSLVLVGGQPGERRIFMKRPGPDGLPNVIFESAARGWVGFNAQGPKQQIVTDDGEQVTYFAYPSIISVDPNSPADRAGIVPGDVLIAFNGTDVVGHEFNLTRLFVPEKKVGVTVRRDGETKDYSLEVVRPPQPVESRRLEFSKIPMPPMAPAPPGAVRVEIPEAEARRMSASVRVRGVMSPTRVSLLITPHGVLGANVSPVGADLAKVLKLEKGVLVNEVPETSPAYKSGVRVGDVIVSASGQAVTTLSELQDQVLSRFGDRSIVLQVVRNHKPTKLTVTW